MKRKIFTAVLFVFVMLTRTGSTGSLFSLETWKSVSFINMLSDFYKVSVIDIPAELELSEYALDGNFARHSIYKHNGKLELVSGKDTLLQPIEDYLNKRWPKQLLTLLREKKLKFSIVKGSFLEGLLVMRQNSIHPTYEVVPEIEGGRRLIIGFNKGNKEPELWILGVEGEDLLVHQLAMLYAAGIKTDEKRIFACQNKTLPELYEKSFKNWKFEEPELWVVGFRDTIDYMVAERIKIAIQYKVLCEEFGCPLSLTLPKKLELELKWLEKLFPEYAKNVRGFYSKIVDSDLDSAWICNIKDFKKIFHFLKECKKTFPKGAPGHFARKIREILDKDSSLTFTSAKTGFLAHPNLSFKRLLYKSKEGYNKSIVLLSNPYGDQMKHLLSALSKSFPKAKVLYLGTAGGLADSMKVSDYVEIPDVSQKKLYSVSSPILETKESLNALKKAGVDFLDVEGKYICEVLQKSPSMSVSAIFAISDLPLKHHSLANFEENRSAFNDILETMVDKISSICEIERIEPVLPNLDEFLIGLKKSRKEYLDYELTKLSSNRGKKQVEPLLERETERRLVPNWLIALPSNGALPDVSLWQKLIKEAYNNEKAEVACFSSKDRITPILGEKISIWKNKKEGISVEFFIKELAEKAFLKWLKNKSTSYEVLPGFKETPGGKKIYVQGEMILCQVGNVRLSYTPWNSDTLDASKQSFVGDRGGFKLESGISFQKELANILKSFSNNLDVYPFKDSSNLIHGQIPAHWYPKNKVKAPPILTSHKLTHNRWIKEPETKRNKDIKDVVYLMTSKLSSYRRRISEGSVSERSKLRMEEVKDSDIGSGQHHLVYISFGSGISYYDSPWKSKEIAIMSPRFVFKNIFSDMALAEFYPRNSWDTLSNGYDRYYAIRSFQGYRALGYAMPLRKRETFLRNLSEGLDKDGLFELKNTNEESFAFMNLSGNGILVNNEIRVPDNLELKDIVTSIIIPKGTKELYEADFKEKGLNPNLLIEAWENNDNGMRLAYMESQLNMFYKRSNSLCAQAIDRPLLKKALMNVTARLSINSPHQFSLRQ